MKKNIILLIALVCSVQIIQAQNVGIGTNPLASLLICIAGWRCVRLRGRTVFESAMAISGSGTDVYIAGSAWGLGAGVWKNGVFTSLPGASQVNGIFVK